jgi:hypothetical protein
MSKLSDLGITRDQSSKWQQLAQIPDGEFEAIFSQPGPKPTTEGVLNAKRAKDAEIPKMDPDALWFWGRLRDFERNEIFERVPDELLALMTDSMRADTLRIVPVLASWLKQIGEQ